jgi:hypothetical protein
MKIMVAGMLWSAMNPYFLGDEFSMYIRSSAKGHDERRLKGPCP